ncbi:MAG: thiamine-phosphate kinase [Syntrophorhabdaceae bacterium]|jgi:thiamine-monophosphate kinase|nr:thiamine-phosphate kinase [Syntrophorhabdaceae bacterium]
MLYKKCRLESFPVNWYDVVLTMELSENELIRKLRRFGRKSGSIVRGIGDDGAVVDLKQGQYVFVQDALVEHVHFEFSFADPFDVGKKAIYVNVSDILSMGAEPLYFLVTIGMPERFSYRDVQILYKGLDRAAREFHVYLLGGDTVSTKGDFFIDISMVGKVIGKKYFGRNKARQGDLIGVTGYLGESAYGLHLLQNGSAAKPPNRYIKRYQSPRPPYDVWKELVKSGITEAMMDISDGLIIDLERMMAESKAGAHLYLEDIPIPPVLKRQGLQTLALSGGEDYQLLFTFPRNKASVVEKIREKGFAISVIGEVVRQRGVRLFDGDREIRLTTKGYEHFGTTQ